MLTMHSFMFISSYENLRSYVRDGTRLDTLAYTWPGTFCRRQSGDPSNSSIRPFSQTQMSRAATIRLGCTFGWRKEPMEAKRQRFEQVLANLRAGTA